MDAGDLLPSLDAVAASGVILSTHYRAILQTSLVLLKNSEKFESVRFWGRISGARQDYFIAQGLGGNHLTEKKSFYRYMCFFFIVAVLICFSSSDAVTWAQLPALHPVLIGTCLKIKGRLQGSPSHEYQVQEPATGANSSVPPEVRFVFATALTTIQVQALRKEEKKDDGSVVYTTTISEDKRLAALVVTIDSDGAVAPRGAYCKSPSGQVDLNPSFAGK